METGLAGRTALVTGASSGIGWAAAAALAREGCRLALQAHRGAARLRERLREHELEQTALVLEADVREREAVERIFAEAAARLGGLDVCVASAGIWPAAWQRLDELDPARIEDVLRTNLLGSLWTARAFLRQAAANGTRGTSLVLVGSTAGRFGEAGHADYAVSKAALRGLLLSYKNEIVLVDPDGRCNLVEPGWTATPMAEEALLDDDGLRRAAQTRPLRRIASAEDVAAAIVYFAAPRLARHVTGETLTVAGGMEGRLLWQPEHVDPEAIRRHVRDQSGSQWAG